MPLSLHVPSPLPWFRARLRRGAAIGLAISAAFGAHSAAAAVPHATTPLSTPPFDVVGWDPNDPVNEADARNFVDANLESLWMSELNDTWPLTSQQIQDQFHNRLPDYFGLVYLRWERVFRKVYAHRLWNIDGTTYDIYELMRDDERIRDEFKRYVLDGVLAPPATDFDAVYEHALLVCDAVTGEGRSEVLDVRVDQNGRLESVGLRVASPSTASEEAAPGMVLSPPGSDDLTVAQRRLCDVRWWARASLLACMYDSGLWAADAEPDAFDCDDFTLAMRNWLRRKMGPDLVISSFLFRWKCPGEPDEKFRGHWMPVVIINGKYYLIDTYTGTVSGPYPVTDAGRKAMARQGIRAIRGQCLDSSDPPNEIEPIWDEPPCFPTIGDNDIPVRVREPRPPFWRDPSSLSRFCSKIAECCGRIPDPHTLEDDGSVDWSQTCAPPPAGADNDSIDQSPCDGRNYLPTPLSTNPSWPSDMDCRAVSPR